VLGVMFKNRDHTKNSFAKKEFFRNGENNKN